MSDTHEPDYAPLPSAEPARPANLSGEALKQWYLQHPPLSEEEQERAAKRKREQQEVTAWVWLMACGTLVVTCHAGTRENLPALVLGPIFASILGVWLTIGRGNLLLRVVFALPVVVCLGWVYVPYRSFLLGCMLLAATMSYFALWLMGLVLRGRARRFRFSIIDIAGAVLLVGCTIALTQDDAASLLANLSMSGPQKTILLLPFFSGNTVLASLPVLVPKRQRTRILFMVSIVLVLVVTPVLEFTLASMLADVVVFVPLVLIHAVGGIVVWAVVFPLDFAGAFRDEEIQPETPTEAAAGHWEEME